jgi:hypothetical protein
MNYFKYGEIMKETAGCGWIARLGGAVLVSLLALPSHAQLMLAHEGHHGAGGCVIETGEFPVTFSAYEVPEGDLPPMHSFCENVPNIGKVNLTIELTDRKSREIPLAVRLVKEGHGGHGGGHDDGAHETAVVSQEAESSEEDHDMDEHAAHDMDEHEGHDMDEHAGHDAQDDASDGASEHGLVFMPPEQHNSGIIVVSTTIEEKGQYALLLEKQDDAGNFSTAVRIPLSFGRGGGHGGHGGGFGMMEILLLLVVVGGGAFYFMRRKKAGEAAEKS